MVDLTSLTKAKHKADSDNMFIIRAPSADLAKTLEETEVQTSMAEHEADTNNTPII